MMALDQPRKTCAPHNPTTKQICKKVTERIGALAVISGLFISGLPFMSSSAQALTNCAVKPSACGYPDATNTGVRAGVKLKKVPSEVSSGPGWRWTPGGVVIDGDGAVFSGYQVNATIDVKADDVVIDNVRVLVGGDTFGIALRHANRTVIMDSEIGSPNVSNRLYAGIKDIYADSKGTRVIRNEIFHTQLGINLYQGIIRDNYIHSMGFWAGDHTNGIMANQCIGRIVIRHNTVFQQLGQTSAIGLYEDFGSRMHDATVENNLVAGGGYSIYGGSQPGGPLPYNVKIINNRFSKKFWSKGGYWGPVAAFDSHLPGNEWTGNVWDENNAKVAP
jgi:hypothetical protein